MKTLRYITIALLILCGVAASQTVTITLQVTDAGGQSWNNGTWSAQLTGCNITCNLLGTSTPVPNQQQSGSLNGTGGASVVVTPVNSIAPSGTQWTFSVCPNATSPCFQSAIAPTSNVTFNDVPSAIAINMQSPQPLFRAYADGELFGQVPGNEYFNVTLGLQKLWNGSSWILFNAGTLGLGDPGANGIVKRTALNTTTIAVVADIIALFSGTCNATTFLRGDGSCQTVSGGTGNVTTAPAAGISQRIVQQKATVFSSSNFANQRWGEPVYNWSFTDSAGSVGNLSVAGSNTLTLPCSVVSFCLGIDTTNLTNALYTVYVSGTGTPEVAPVTGGTCLPGSIVTCTIVVTTVSTHAAGFMVGSQSSGIQEAINDACRGTDYTNGNLGGMGEVDLEPAGLSGTPNYTIQGQVYLNGRNTTGCHLYAHSAQINCANARAACIFMGNYGGSGAASIISDLNVANGNSFGGVNILDITAAAGTFTVHTASAHNFSMTANQGGPDYVYVDWHDAGGRANRGIFKVTSVADSTHFTYVNGATTFANNAAFGSAGLENAMIEDNSDGSKIENTRLVFGLGPGSPLFTIVDDNDQNMTIDKLTTTPNGALCNANICGYVVFSRGDNGNAGIVHIHDSEISVGCNGNGVLALSGNGLTIDGMSVVQGYQQVGIYDVNGLVSSSIKDVYEESTGACNNPSAPAGAQHNQVGLMSFNFVTRLGGAFPMVGTFPQFVSGGGGGSQINYFVVWSSGGNKSVPLPVGTAQPTSGAVSIPVSFPSQATAAAQTFDLIATTGGAYTPLVGTLTVAVATGQTCTPNSQGWCTFTDTQAARSSYTFATPALNPSLWYWPGTIVLNGSTLMTDFASAGIISNRANQVSVVSLFCPSNSTVGPLVPPTLYACLGADPLNGTGSLTMFLQQPDASNNTLQGLKGRLNTGALGNLLGGTGTDLWTVVDSNLNKTAASSGNRAAWDAADVAIGTDCAAGNLCLTLRARDSISQYINAVGDGSSWLERLTASLKSFKVPISGTSTITTTGLGTFNGVTSSGGAISTPTGPVSGNWNCVSVAPVTVSTSTTNDQNLMACTVPAGTLNSVGKTLRIHTKSLYTTPAASVATLTFKAKLCSVSGCSSGNVATLVSIVSSANPGSVTNNTAILDLESTTQTAGAASRSEASGSLLIDLGAVATSPDTIFADTNATVVAGSPSDIDFTAQNFLQITVAFSVASGSNSVTERQLTVDSVN